MCKKYLSIVKKSPLIFKIRKAAPDFFLFWKEYQRIQYAQLQFNADPEKIISDMEESFASALKSLVKIEDKSRNYKINFIYGFVSSNLCTGWSNDYIYTETSAYKEIMLLKSLMLYLENNLETTKKIKALYDALINNKTEVLEKHQDQKNNIISLDVFRNKIHAEDADGSIFLNFIVGYLKSTILEKHHLAFREIMDDDFCPNIEIFFDREDISSLLDLFDNRPRDE